MASRLAFTAFLGGCALVGGNVWFSRRFWKQEHPIVSESLTFINRNKRICELLEAPVTLSRASIKGILDANQPWANLNFKIKGQSKEHSAVVSVLAEISDDGLLPVPLPPSSFIERQLYPLTLEDTKGKWKILSLYVKIDDTNTYPIIAENYRTHAELQESDVDDTGDIEIQKQWTPTLDQRTKVAQRRENQFSKLRERYLWLFVLSTIGGLSFVAWKFFGWKHLPVGNSVFQEVTFRRVQAERVICQELGQPLQILPGVKGTITSNFKKAHIEYILFGPAGHGKITASGVFDKNANQWKFSEFQFAKDGVVKDLA